MLRFAEFDFRANHRPKSGYDDAMHAEKVLESMNGNVTESWNFKAC
jgi:hypothetical protein